MVRQSPSPRRKKPSQPQGKSPVKAPSTAQAPFLTPASTKHTPVKHSFVEPSIDMQITNQASALGYEPGTAWIQKVKQLYTIIQVKHGMYVNVYVCVCVCVCVCVYIYVCL